jgi:hypothetical protein
MMPHLYVYDVLCVGGARTRLKEAATTIAEAEVPDNNSKDNDAETGDSSSASVARKRAKKIIKLLKKSK